MAANACPPFSVFRLSLSFTSPRQTQQPVRRPHTPRFILHFSRATLTHARTAAYTGSDWVPSARQRRNMRGRRATRRGRACFLRVCVALAAGRPHGFLGAAVGKLATGTSSTRGHYGRRVQE